MSLLSEGLNNLIATIHEANEANEANEVEEAPLPVFFVEESEIDYLLGEKQEESAYDQTMDLLAPVSKLRKSVGLHDALGIKPPKTGEHKGGVFLQFKNEDIHKANSIKITLGPDDLYTLTFYRQADRGIDLKKIVSSKNVAPNQMCREMEKKTGLKFN